MIITNISVQGNDMIAYHEIIYFVIQNNIIQVFMMNDSFIRVVRSTRRSIRYLSVYGLSVAYGNDGSTDDVHN